MTGQEDRHTMTETTTDLREALHKERSEGHTQNVACWACEATRSTVLRDLAAQVRTTALWDAAQILWEVPDGPDALSKAIDLVVAAAKDAEVSSPSLAALAPRLVERERAAAAKAWDEGYQAAYSMARGYGHTDSWEDEPGNPYSGEAVPR